MNLLKQCMLGILLWLSMCLVAAGQGCVAVRPMSCSSPGVAGGLIVAGLPEVIDSTNISFFNLFL